MHDEIFHQSIRRLLKNAGVNAQQAIEKAVQQALDEGRLQGHESFPATVTLSVPELSLYMEFHDVIELE